MTIIFDHKKIANNHKRALQSKGDFFMHKHAHQTIEQRLLDIKRKFETPLTLSLLPEETTPQADINSEVLGIEPSSHDLIISVMTLHNINDLPGMLVQIKKALQPDGAFLFAMPGSETLKTTRECLMNAEIEVSGGANARFHPMIGLQQMAGLMQRAGFALPVVDQERITISSSNIFKAARDIRLSGEGVALNGYRAKPLTKAILNTLEQNHPRDTDGNLEFTIDMIYGIGWAPAPSQPKPLKPGSATKSMTEALS